MKFQGDVTIEAPRERAWGFLTDPHQIVAVRPTRFSRSRSSTTSASLSAYGPGSGRSRARLRALSCGWSARRPSEPGPGALQDSRQHR